MELKLNDIKLNEISDPLDYSFTNGKINFVIGSNDSNACKLLDVIAGMRIPSSGTIFINNRTNKPNVLLNRTYYLNDDIYSMVSNIKVIDEIKSYTSFKKEKLMEYMKHLNLEDDVLNKNISDISNSELKKVLLISILLSDRKVLLLNKPDIYLDPKSLQGLIKILRVLRKEDRIIMINTNNMNFLLELADTIILLDDQKSYLNTKYEMFENKKLLELNNIYQPKVIEMTDYIKEKNIKLNKTDNINDLIKEIYRNA